MAAIRHRGIGGGFSLTGRNRRPVKNTHYPELPGPARPLARLAPGAIAPSCHVRAAVTPYPTISARRRAHATSGTPISSAISSGSSCAATPAAQEAAPATRPGASLAAVPAPASDVGTVAVAATARRRWLILSVGAAPTTGATIAGTADAYAPGSPTIAIGTARRPTVAASGSTIASSPAFFATPVAVA